MANNFPAVPSGLLLTSVEYAASFGQASQATPAALSFTGTSIQFGGAFNALGGGSAVEYVFNTPGTFGSFDQTTAEANIKTLMTNACQVLVTITGIPLATIQAAVSISRRWTWTDAAGSRAVFTDTLTYP